MMTTTPAPAFAINIDKPVKVMVFSGGQPVVLMQHSSIEKSMFFNSMQMAFQP